MLADSVLQYLRRYAVVPGRAAVLYANNDGAYQAIFALADAGVAVAVSSTCAPMWPLRSWPSWRAAQSASLPEAPFAQRRAALMYAAFAWAR